MYGFSVNVMDPGNKDNVRDLVLHVQSDLNDRGHEIENEFPSKKLDRIVLISKNEESLELAIQKFYDHKHSPLRGFEKVKSFDIELEVIEDDGYLLNTMFEEEKRLNRRLIQMVSTSIHQHESDISGIDAKISGINDYLSNSGIIHYKKFMEQFIDMLDANQLIPNGDYVKERMFSANQNNH